MQIIRYYKKKVKDKTNKVITIGNFDGLHLGHKLIIKKVIETAEKNNLTSCVLSFYSHTSKTLSASSYKTMRIMNLRDKIRILDNMGVELLVLLNFTKEFGELTAEQFIKNVLINNLNVSHIIVGDDFKFGKDGVGDVDLLKRYFNVQTIVKNNYFSSTNIRKYLFEGNLEEVKKILGRNYKIIGRVVHGKKDGQKIGFATANININKLSLPKLGVYAVKIKYNNKKFFGVANIGIRPTFNEKSKLLEVHIFDFDKNIYNKIIEVEFIRFLREEKKFKFLEQLKEQIKIDIKNTKKLLCFL